MPTNARKTRSQRTHNAVALLKSDHAEVSALFGKYDRGAKRLKSDQKAALAQQICDALSVHAKIEEEIFYPACHDHVAKAEDLLAEAKVEHQSLKELIAKIEREQPGSEEYDAQVKVLAEYVKHHVKEEQNELFPKVRKSDMDLNAVGEQLASRKEQLQNSA